MRTRGPCRRLENEALGRSGRSRAVQVGRGDRRADRVAHVIALVRSWSVEEGWAKEQPVQGAAKALCVAPKRASGGEAE